MLTQEEINRARGEDLRKQKNFEARMNDLKEAERRALEKRYDNLRGRLRDLLDKKAELYQAPMTKEEVLELSKQALRKHREENSIQAFLVRHLQNSMERKNVPLEPLHVRLELFGRDDAWKLVYWIITEEDLEAAALLLPETGLSDTECDAQIEALEKEISELEICIKDEQWGEKEKPETGLAGGKEALPSDVLINGDEIQEEKR